MNAVQNFAGDFNRQGATVGGCGDVQKGLIQRQGLDKRCVAAQDGHNQTGGLSIGIHAGANEACLGQSDRARAANMAE